MHEISGVKELDKFILENINDNVVVLYFGAVWCGPCRQLKDYMNNPATQSTLPYMAMGYLDVDDEENEKLLKGYKVKSLPTQIFVKLKDNEVIEVKRIEGFDVNQLKAYYDALLKKN